MISFCAETAVDTLPYLKECFPLHWEELALNKDKVPLDPQYDLYLEREQRGELMLVVGRENGEIVAYFVGFVAPGMHYKTCLTLIMDIFYVMPKHRGKMTGIRLFKFVQQEAKNRGVDRMFVGTKCHKDAGWLFEKLGYEEVERTYSMWLGE